MSHVPKVMNAFSTLLSYPDQHTAQAAELLFVVLQDDVPTGAKEASLFGSFLEQHETWEIEEAFTGTFDVNPACALEVGWHLFGEEYARGMFLVRMREEMRKYNLAESSELPDHIAHVLDIVAAMPDDEAEKFVHACVLPALKKMNLALAEKETPYRHVVSALVAVMQTKWGEGKDPEDEVLGSRASEVDLLHAFPVAQAECGGGCGCGEPDLIPLELGNSQSSLPIASNAIPSGDKRSSHE